MEFINSELKGIIIISLKPNIDNRGFFVRTYDNNVFNENGLKFDWVQENHSKTVKSGTIRGLHFQLPPFA